MRSFISDMFPRGMVPSEALLYPAERGRLTDDETVEMRDILGPKGLTPVFCGASVAPPPTESQLEALA